MINVKNQAPRRPCAKPGCGKLSNGTYCEEHTKQKQVVQKQERIKYDNERGTSASRGYNYRWQKYSAQYRVNNPLCVMCLKVGKLIPAQCVDHIIAVESKDDPLFWDASNHQSLCNTCHNIKSEAEGNRFNDKQRERFL